MKKKIIAALGGICTVVVMTGCGNKGISNDKITIKQYKGLEVEKVDPVEVTDTDVEDSINSTLQTKSTQNDITDRPAQEGDVVTIDYEGKKDGVAFDGGTAQDQQLELGSGSFIDGFEDGIVGHNIGETFDLNLTFPEDYKSEDLAGQAVVFTVTLDKISEVIVPAQPDHALCDIRTSLRFWNCLCLWHYHRQYGTVFPGQAGIDCRHIHGCLRGRQHHFPAYYAVPDWFRRRHVYLPGAGNFVWCYDNHSCLFHNRTS